MNWLFIGLGGGVGAMLRFTVGNYMIKKFPQSPIPIAMLVVNIIGAFGLGLFLGSYFGSEFSKTSFYLFVSVGFFGAFTTFSTFSVETMQLLLNREVKKALLYVILTLILTITFFIGGFWIIATGNS